MKAKIKEMFEIIKSQKRHRPFCFLNQLLIILISEKIAHAIKKRPFN